MSSKKFMDLHDLAESPTQAVWVLNVSEEISDSGDKSDVIIIVNYNDSYMSLMVPKSWLPVNLAARLPKKALMDSANFLDGLYKGLIKIITAEYATELNSLDGADNERRRLRELEEQVKAASRARGVNVELIDNNRQIQTSVSPSRGNIDVSNLDSNASSETSAVEEEISVQFKALVKRLNTLDVKDAVNELKLRGSLNKRYAKYLHDHIIHTSIKQHLSKLIGAV